MLLIDENLSYKLQQRLKDDFDGICAVANLSALGEGTSDDEVWSYARANKLAVLTKDSDFVSYWKRFGPPPKVVKLNLGNCRLAKIDSHIREKRDEIMFFLLKSNEGLLVI